MTQGKLRFVDASPEPTEVEEVGRYDLSGLLVQLEHAIKKVDAKFVVRDSIILVSGPTGGGKTLISTMFAAAACKAGEKVLLLAYEESHQQLLRNAHSWGVDFKKWEDEGLLKIICFYPKTKISPQRI
jgi:predicted ATP-dependent serine protease